MNVIQGGRQEGKAKALRSRMHAAANEGRKIAIVREDEVYYLEPERRRGTVDVRGLFWAAVFSLPVWIVLGVIFLEWKAKR